MNGIFRNAVQHIKRQGVWIRSWQTLQPISDTRERQIQLWKDLVLDYCKHNRIHTIQLDSFDLFANTAIDRRLSSEAKEVFLGALVAEGRAEWYDKTRQRCLVLWKRVEEWAQVILEFAQENGVADGGVMTIEDLRIGDEVRGTELEGLDENVLNRALRLLEQRGRATVFTGSSDSERGVKFGV